MTRAKLEQNKTLHPRMHEWFLKGDFVHKRDRRGILIVERVEHCGWCKRERRRLWDVRRWEKISQFSYKGDMPSYEDRMSQADAAKAEFLATTDIAELITKS